MKTSKFISIGALILAVAFLSASNVKEANAFGPNMLELQMKQPDIPKTDKHIEIVETSALDIDLATEIAGLGPQPEPPDYPVSIRNPEDIAGISPQPEPPTLPAQTACSVAQQPHRSPAHRQRRSCRDEHTA